MRALQVRAIVQQRVDALFDQCDVVAAPSLPITATPLETNLETDLNFSDPLGGIGNLCGLPAAGVPCGFSSKNLPIGMQFAARVRNDAAVLAAAAQFQAHTEWHSRRPPIG
jgi:aspartyl-tRNA(Asn)/glutamyl-tRNA(Gln) amidotransferase subunit A